MATIEQLVEQRCDEYRQRAAELESQLSESEQELARYRRAIEVAFHHLNTEHGLWATDQPQAYADAMRDGLDSEEAFKCFQETLHRLDHKAAIEELNSILNTPIPPLLSMQNELKQAQATISENEQELASERRWAKHYHDACGGALDWLRNGKVWEAARLLHLALGGRPDDTIEDVAPELAQAQDTIVQAQADLIRWREDFYLERQSKDAALATCAQQGALIAAMREALRKFYFHLDTYGFVDQHDGDPAVKSQDACFAAYHEIREKADQLAVAHDAAIRAEERRRVLEEAAQDEEANWGIHDPRGVAEWLRQLAAQPKEAKG